MNRSISTRDRIHFETLTREVQFPSMGSGGRVRDQRTNVQSAMIRPR